MRWGECGGGASAVGRVRWGRSHKWCGGEAALPRRLHSVKCTLSERFPQPPLDGMPPHQLLTRSLWRASRRTMGNIATTAEDLAKLFYDVVTLAPSSKGYVSSATLSQMMEWHPLQEYSL